MLEAFAGLPELELTVCGPVDKEPDFVECYRRELYGTANIRTVGWVDVAGAQFAEIVARCGSLVYPSCSEGCAGAAVTCLHAGLIPLVTAESGIDVGDFGELFPTPTVAQIRHTARAIAACDPDELRGRSRAAWDYARAFHTRENFAAAFRAAVQGLLSGEGATTASGNAARIRDSSSAVASR